MRQVFILVLAMAIGFGTAAVGATPAGQVGPFTLGMTVDAVRAAAPGVWTQEGDGNQGILRSSRPVVELGGRYFVVEIAFTESTVHTFTLFHLARMDDAEACIVAHGAVVRSLSQAFGPLDQFSGPESFPTEEGDSASPDVARKEVSPAATTLPDGSVVNVFAVNDTQSWLIGSKRADVVDVLTTFALRGARANRCAIGVTIWDEALRSRLHAARLAREPVAPVQDAVTQANLRSRLDVAERLENPVFTATPAEPVWRFYPEVVVQLRQPGEVAMECIVLDTGALDCLIVSEEPQGWGFGAAALRIVEGYRVDLSSGAAGKRVRMRVPFTFS